jgi:predicted secreted protein
VKWLAQVAREVNPAASLIPQGSSDAVGTIKDEIAAIEKYMRTDRAGYFKDTDKQERYRQLLTAQEKYAAR